MVCPKAQDDALKCLVLSRNERYSVNCHTGVEKPKKTSHLKAFNLRKITMQGSRVRLKNVYKYFSAKLGVQIVAFDIFFRQIDLALATSSTGSLHRAVGSDSEVQWCPQH